MVNLKEAIRLTELEDDEIVYLRSKGAGKHDAKLVTVAEIRKRYDMRKTKVLHIRPRFHFCGGYAGMEFEINID